MFVFDIAIVEEWTRIRYLIIAILGKTAYDNNEQIMFIFQMITSDGDGILPAPSISVESRGKNGLRVCWKRSSKGVDPKYKLLLHVVNIVGTKFAKEINNSDIRLV